MDGDDSLSHVGRQAGLDLDRPGLGANPNGLALRDSKPHGIIAMLDSAKSLARMISTGASRWPVTKIET